MIQALEGVCRFLDSRGEPVRRLPPEQVRHELLAMGAEVIRAVTQMVGELLESGMETAWLDADLPTSRCPLSDDVPGDFGVVRARSRSRSRVGDGRAVMSVLSASTTSTTSGCSTTCGM